MKSKTNVMQQKVIEESVRVQQVEREAQVKVQEAEIARRERELIATVLKPAEVERQRIETLASSRASAFHHRSRRPRLGHPSAGRSRSGNHLQKGRSEAKAMEREAEAFQEYNQAAVLDKFISGMPEVVRALAEPLKQGRQGDHRFHRQMAMLPALTS